MNSSATATHESLITRFDQPGFVPAEVFLPAKFSRNVSPDGQAVSVLMEDFLVELSAVNGEKYNATNVGILQIPLTLPSPLDEEFLGYYIRLDGFVDKTNDAKATVYVEAGEATKTIEFPYGKPLHEDVKEELFSFAFPPAPHLNVIIVLSLQRSAVEDSALLKIDTLSIEINRLRKIPAA